MQAFTSAARQAARARLTRLGSELRPHDEQPPVVPEWQGTVWRLDRRALRALMAVLAVAVAASAWFWWNGRPLPAEVVSGPFPAQREGASIAPGRPLAGGGGSEVIVDVSGDVAAPGLVTLPAGSRVADAITAAGGATGPTTGVNLARVLVDGEQVTVGATAPGGDPSKVSINTADAGALDALPGIGPVLAQRIIDWRTTNGPFPSVDALGDVPGIGPSLLAKVKPLVTT